MKINGHKLVSLTSDGGGSSAADSLRLAQNARFEAETGARPKGEQVSACYSELAQSVRRQLELVGEDPHREGLLQTPARVAKSLAFLTRGYHEEAKEVVGEAIFEEDHGSMVVMRDIEVYSLCEHHMLPFFGKAHVAYIPDGRIIGLSKLPRLVDVFARRLQVQERLCSEVASAVDEILRPRGVAVMIEAAHLCMMMRGVEKQRSITVTSALRGLFLSDPSARDEFYRITSHASDTW